MKLKRVKLLPRLKPRLKLKRKTAVKLGIFLTVIALIGGGLVFAINLAKGPATGTVAVNTTSQSETTHGDNVLTSKYYITHYPSRYSEVPSGTTASLESRTLYGHISDSDQQSSKISVIVTSLPDGGVQEDSAYKLYASQPSLYKISNSVYGGDPVIVAVRQDPTFQHTVLWPHGKYLLTISMTAGTETPLIDSEMQTVTSHLKWLL